MTSMECIKSEALRTMEMAEQKFASQDYSAARTLALKAQQLFPSLENIAQMIAVIDVHAAAQTRIGINEKDWYGILQVEPSADDAVVKKQYRKLALFLHPDKNKSIGAESAFKLIGEALQVLSDKVKRLVYDAKRGMHMQARGNHVFSGSSQVVDGANGWQNHFFQTSFSNAAAHSSTINKANQRHFPQPPQTGQAAGVSQAAGVASQSDSHLFTFWTACTSCQMRYQYYRKYENQNLLCPQCRRPFIAKDLSSMPRVNVPQSWPPRASVDPNSSARQSNSHIPGNYGSSPHTFGNYSASSFKYFNNFSTGSRPDTFQSFAGASSHVNGKGAAQFTTNFTYGTGVPESAEKELARKLEELQRRVQIEKDLANQSKQFKKFVATEKAREAWAESFMRNHSNSNGNGDNIQEVPAAKKARIETEVGNVKQDPEVEMNRKLADLAKNAIRLKLNLPGAKPNVPNASLGLAPGKGKDNSGLKERHEHIDKKTNNKAKTESSAKKDVVLASCTVPDADFHNFDVSREEKDVEVGQIWALYDDKEGMPKYYMKVKEVRSRTPFKVLIGWFEIRKPSEEICDLLDSGFSIGCGEFRISASQKMNSVNSFSHLVSSERSGKGLVKIYPKKGDVWCIYKDWKPGQLTVKGDEATLKYSLVEVLADCSEESGAVVMLLKKVEGFKTIFQFSNEQVLEIPFLELLRFSHRVPAHKLKGDEAPGIPKDCWELDPAAVPSCLVHPDAKVGMN